MEKKAQYETKEPSFPFSLSLWFISLEVKIDAMLEAQHRALVGIAGMERNAARTELYWLIYQTEFRQYIERWSRENA